MLSNIGNSLLFINILLSIFIIYFSFKNLEDSKKIINRNIYNMCLIQSTSIIICFFTLIAGFIVSDFSLINVYQNSHSLSLFSIKFLERGEIMKEVYYCG